MNMNVENWELKDSCDEIQWYYQSKLNDDMIACVVIPHKGNYFRWLLRIGFKSTFNKWGDVEYENTFDYIEREVKTYFKSQSKFIVSIINKMIYTNLTK